MLKPTFVNPTPYMLKVFPASSYPQTLHHKPYIIQTEKLLLQTKLLEPYMTKPTFVNPTPYMLKVFSASSYIQTLHHKPYIIRKE